MNSTFRYTKQKAGVEQVIEHLLVCNPNFVPRLDTVINILEYAQKIVDHADTFEAWVESELVGLVAVYTNRFPKAFITNVSVFEMYNGLGIAKRLINEIERDLLKNGFKEVLLEVNVENRRAVSFYERLAFVEYSQVGNLRTMRKSFS